MINDEVQSTLSQQSLNPQHKSKFAFTNKSSNLAKNRSYSSRALDPTQILKNTEISQEKCSLSKGSNLLHHSFINNSSKKFSTSRQDNTSAVQRNKYNKLSQQQQQQRTSKSSIKYHGNQNSKIQLSYNQNAVNQALITKNEQKLRQQQFISSIQVVQTFEESQNKIVIDHHDDDNDEQKIEKINISSPLQRSLSRSATQKQLRSSESLTDVDRTVIHDDTFCLSKEVADILITPEKIDNINNLITTNNQYQTNASNNKSFLIMSMTDSKGEVETQLILQQQITPSSGSDQPEKNDDLNFEQQMKEAIVSAAHIENIDQSVPLTLKNLPQEEDIIEIDVIFDFLIKEEERLNQFSQMSNLGQLIELKQQVTYSQSQSYLNMIKSVDCKKERPKFFSQQLQVSLILSNALIGALNSQLLQRFSQKFRTIYTNIHQNFLLYIDTILNCCNANPTENINYGILRKLMVKKLKNKQKSQRLTCFRQNNEVNILIIKKICKSLIDQSGSLDCNQEFYNFTNMVLNIIRSYDSMNITEIQELTSSISKTLKKKGSPLNSPTKRSRSNSRNNSPKTMSPRTQYQRNKIQLQDICTPLKRALQSNEQQKQLRTTSDELKNTQLSKTTTRSGIVKNDSFKQQKMTIDGSLGTPKAFSTTGLTFKTATQQSSVGANQSKLLNQTKSSQPKNGFYLPETRAFMLTNSVECDNVTVSARDSGMMSHLNNICGESIQQQKIVTERGIKKIEIGDTKASNLPSKYNSGGLNNELGSLIKTSIIKKNLNQQQKSKISVKQQKMSQSEQKNIRSNPNKNSIQRPISSLALDSSQNLRQIRRPSISASINSLAQQEEKTSIESNYFNSLDKNKRNNLDELTFNQIGLSRDSSKIQTNNLNVNGQSNIKNSKNQNKVYRPPSSNPPSSLNVNPVMNQNINNLKTKPTPKVTPNKQPLHKINSKITSMKQDLSLLSITPVKTAQLSQQNSRTSITKSSILLDPRKNLKVNQLDSGESKYRQKASFQLQSSNKTETLRQPKFNTQSKKSVEQQLTVNSKKQFTSSILKKQSQRPSPQFEMCASNNSSRNSMSSSETKQKDINNQQSITNITQEMTVFDCNEDNDYPQRCYSQQNIENSEISVLMDDILLKKGEIKLDQMLAQMEIYRPATEVNSLAESQAQIQFGSLLQQHIGGLDLKSEMEKLKQLDHQQKKYQRVKVMIENQPNMLFDNLGLLNNAEFSNIKNIKPHIDSPNKKIFKGEFDEIKEDCLDNDRSIKLGEEILLSRDSSAAVSFRQLNAAQPRRSQYQIPTDEDLAKINKEFNNKDLFAEQVDPNEEDQYGENQYYQDQDNLENDIDQQHQIDDEQQKLRQLVKIPYLPKLSGNKEYTLVLDLDETLIHYDCDEDNENGQDDDEEEQGYYLIRPGCIKFLQELSKYYDLVIFTAAMPDYADWILNNVDRNNLIKHRLYRQHTTPHEDYAIKDLKNLGRSLEKTIIIDNLAENFIHTTPNNGIWVESWYDDMDDSVLELLLPFLKEIVTEKLPDVRKLLTKEIKEKIVYRYLEEGKNLPSIHELMGQTLKNN